MSVRLMAEVWEYATDLSGTSLLMLLAVADHCNDDRIAWPSVARLAAKCRIGERQAQYMLRDLETRGYIKTNHGRGRTHTSLYQITPYATWPTKGAADCTINDEKVQSPEEKVQSSAEKVQSDSIKGAIAIAPEPSLTIKEPSLLGGKVQNIAPIEGGGGDTLASLYMQLYGNRGLTKRGEHELDDWIRCYGEDAVRQGLEAAWKANATRPAYALKVMENLATGKASPPKPGAAQPIGGAVQRW